MIVDKKTISNNLTLLKIKGDLSTIDDVLRKLGKTIITKI